MGVFLSAAHIHLSKLAQGRPDIWMKSFFEWAFINSNLLLILIFFGFCFFWQNLQSKVRCGTIHYFEKSANFHDFLRKNFENCRFWKSQFFWVGHFENFFAKFFFFASFPWKLVNIYRIARMGQNFDDYSDFQKIPGMPILLQHSVLTIYFFRNRISLKHTADQIDMTIKSIDTKYVAPFK